MRQMKRWKHRSSRSILNALVEKCCYYQLPSLKHLWGFRKLSLKKKRRIDKLPVAIGAAVKKGRTLLAPIESMQNFWSHS